VLPFIAAVGQLQFEVLAFRMADEYGCQVRLTALPYRCSGWLVGDVATFVPTPGSQLAIDSRGRHVVLFPSEWDRNYCFRQNPEHSFREYA
jgi:peptide chain release factor 3